mmetsp:Transcript_20588/g.48002  ORF Transcript_20588/g.48002 Transcript_20588/m.48002 type:complete len:230 (-) Transcript_20588:314-1003(-)
MITASRGVHTMPATVSGGHRRIAPRGSWVRTTISTTATGPIFTCLKFGSMLKVRAIMHVVGTTVLITIPSTTTSTLTSSPSTGARRCARQGTTVRELSTAMGVVRSGCGRMGSSRTRRSHQATEPSPACDTDIPLTSFSRWIRMAPLLAAGARASTTMRTTMRWLRSRRPRASATLRSARLPAWPRGLRGQCLTWFHAKESSGPWDVVSFTASSSNPTILTSPDSHVCG